jgi:hypothetical protein
MSESNKPRYAPRSAFVTRSSGAEAQGQSDFAATALDRPVLDLEDLRRAHATRSSASMVTHGAVSRGPNVKLVAAIVIAIALALGAIVGAIAALM